MSWSHKSQVIIVASQNKTRDIQISTDALTLILVSAIEQKRLHFIIDTDNCAVGHKIGMEVDEQKCVGTLNQRVS